MMKSFDEKILSIQKYEHDMNMHKKVLNIITKILRVVLLIHWREIEEKLKAVFSLVGFTHLDNTTVSTPVRQI